MSAVRHTGITLARTWLRRAVLVVAAGLLLLLAGSLITGHGLNVRSFARSMLDLIQAVSHSQSVISPNPGDFRNVVFLHHSVGTNLIEQGHVREKFVEAGYVFWDHGYNWQGLRDPAGQPTGYSYNVPSDNTDPDGLASIFAQPVYGIPLDTLSGLLQHDVIAFKSCFPASQITHDEELAQDKAWYAKIRDVMDQRRDKVFIAITPPPLNPAETTPEAAARARAFANWLTSDEFLNGHSNVFTFDLFGYLAEDDPASPDYNMLRKDYRDGADSHPNQAANQTVGPLLVDFIVKAADRYRPISPSP